MIKHTACPKEMFRAVLNARPFDSEEECLDAVLHHRVQKGDAVDVYKRQLIDTLSGGTAYINAFYIFVDQVLGKSLCSFCADTSVILVAGIKCRNNSSVFF